MARNIGVCFDIDGVIRRGQNAIPRAKAAVHRLVQHGIPFMFITNGGGCHEADRAKSLSELLDVNVSSRQVVLAHSPLKSLAEDRTQSNLVNGDGVPLNTSWNNKRVLVLGCKNELAVAKEYGFKKVVSPQAFVRQNPDQYPWPQRCSSSPVVDEFEREAISGIMVMHDPIDWHLEVQVCLDILLGTCPFSSRSSVGDNMTLKPTVQKVPVFNTNEDLVFASGYPYPRLAQGSFLLTLSHLFRHLSGGLPLQVERFGKPNKITFDFAHSMLKEVHHINDFCKIFMIGDNVDADIKGANDAGDPWHSILVKTGVYKPGQNVGNAKTVCDDVNAAVDFILRGSWKV